MATLNVSIYRYESTTEIQFYIREWGGRILCTGKLKITNITRRLGGGLGGGVQAV
jgi:hypothetical protein